MLAGGRGNFVDNYYLNTGQTYWSLSFTNYYANGFVIDASEYLLNNDIKKSAGLELRQLLELVLQMIHILLNKVNVNLYTLGISV